MSLQWCRLYGEMVDDAKLKLLAFEDRWHFVALLCLKTQGVLDDSKPELLDRVVGAKLGLASREADEVRRRLIEVDLISQDWQPLAWDRRQFKSDNSTARVQAWRAAHSSPLHPPPEKTDTETETDTEGKRCKQRSRNVSETLHLHSTLPTDAWEEWLAHRKAQRFTCSPAALKRQLSMLAKFDAATQREIIDNSIQAGWKGLFPPKGNGNGKPRLTRYEESMARLNAARDDEPPPTTNPLMIGGRL